MSKISFKNENKHIPGFPLNKIETIGNFQDQNNDNQLKQDKLDQIDFYANQLDDIIANKKSSGIAGAASRKILEPEIASIYLLVTGKPKGGLKKNEMIDIIERFYRTQYVPRESRNQSKTAVIISDNKFDTQKQNSISHLSDSDDDSDIDI